MGGEGGEGGARDSSGCLGVINDSGVTSSWSSPSTGSETDLAIGDDIPPDGWDGCFLHLSDRLFSLVFFLFLSRRV